MIQSELFLDLSPYLAACIALPVYHFIIYPLFYNRVPTLLKRIGLGLLLSSMQPIACAVIQYTWVYVQVDSNNLTCMFDPEFERSIEYLFITVIAPGFLAMLYMTVFVYFPLEFIVSQTPFQVKGLALGILFVLFFVSPTISG